MIRNKGMSHLEQISVNRFSERSIIVSSVRFRNGGDDSVGREPSFHTQTKVRQTDTINKFFALNQEEIWQFSLFIYIFFVHFVFVLNNNNNYSVL